jgi:hypothetical protein
MNIFEFIIGLLVTGPLMIIGFGVFCCVWFYCFKWIFIWLVGIGEKYFKKDSWQQNIFMCISVGSSGLLSFYFMIYFFVTIAKENGF